MLKLEVNLEVALRLHLTIAALAQKMCLYYIMKLPVSLMLMVVALTIVPALSSPIRDVEVGLVA